MVGFMSQLLVGLVATASAESTDNCSKTAGIDAASLFATTGKMKPGRLLLAQRDSLTSPFCQTLEDNICSVISGSSFVESGDCVTKQAYKTACQSAFPTHKDSSENEKKLRNRCEKLRKPLQKACDKVTKGGDTFDNNRCFAVLVSEDACPMVTGQAFNLNYILAKGPTQGMSIEFNLPETTSAPLQAYLDTGSTELTICETNLSAELAHLRTDLVQCGFFEAPDPNVTECDGFSGPGFPGAFPEFFAGAAYNATVQFPDTQSGDMRAEHAMAVVADREQGLPCNDFPVQAILGVAFTGLSALLVVPGGNSSLVFHECPENTGFCDFEGRDITEQPSPLQVALTQNGYSKFGIHFDYAKTAGLQLGLTKDLGTMYVGELATHNQHFQRSVAGTVTTFQKSFKSAHPESTHKDSSWNFVLAGFTVSTTPGGTPVYTQAVPAGGAPPSILNPHGFEGEGANIIVDSGTSSLILPEGVYNASLEVYDFGTNPNASLNLHIYKNFFASGFEDSTVPVSFPVAFLKEQKEAGFLSFAGPPPAFNGFITLGFPLFRYYYMVFDYVAATMTFAKLS